MKDLPKNVCFYKRTKSFSCHSIPKALLTEHVTKEGSWGQIIVEMGQLKYHIKGDEPEEIILNAQKYGVIEPRVWHFVSPIGEVIFHIAFHRKSN